MSRVVGWPCAMGIILVMYGGVGSFIEMVRITNLTRRIRGCNTPLIYRDPHYVLGGDCPVRYSLS